MQCVPLLQRSTAVLPAAQPTSLRLRRKHGWVPQQACMRGSMQAGIHSCAVVQEENRVFDSCVQDHVWCASDYR